jgi:hypothetical protein
LQQQGDGSRKSGRFSLYRREKEKEREREREREQQQRDSQVGRGSISVSVAAGQDSGDSRLVNQKPVVHRAEALFACEYSFVSGAISLRF